MSTQFIDMRLELFANEIILRLSVQPHLRIIHGFFEPPGFLSLQECHQPIQKDTWVWTVGGQVRQRCLD
ncbi:hypothetical protein LOY44_16830 [Pseudomonas sp. B21-044]|uniref:hypothetical protein n=1 Tax=Pseudomonas sp. B21-044 TaxID=2895488 RepID=UPI00215E81E6|nr:hypothetical protein [Pseudomonas sp. B21-044]UVL17667.1 hypothetical protein LOY44_16830 [Pseudomonas sp. B21-044]